METENRLLCPLTTCISAFSSELKCHFLDEAFSDPPTGSPWLGSPSIWYGSCLQVCLNGLGSGTEGAPFQ